MPNWFSSRTKWLTIGIGVKRWLLLLMFGVMLCAMGITYGVQVLQLAVARSWLEFILLVLLGIVVIVISLYFLTRSILAPYRISQQGAVVDIVYAHRKREKGPKVVAIGGGTGLPSVLRGLKSYTSNITAVVTVADDGGSSGRLRREMGILPPGDLRNNIAALADDESLMTRLFQYRFDNGDLGGHSFGNLFITALAGVSGSIETALAETAKVLNIQGRVLPASLEDVNLVAKVRLNGMTQTIKIKGESLIGKADAKIEHVALSPEDIQAYQESVTAILEADLVVIGPGSLYTSILPNLLVNGIAEAMRTTSAYRVYICNVATQPGETADYNVADHIVAVEEHIGQEVFQAVLANNCYPTENAGEYTHYVQPIPAHHEILTRYDIIYTDLTDMSRPWRHDPQKLAHELMELTRRIQSHDLPNNPLVT